MSLASAQFVQKVCSHPAPFHAAIWVCLKGTVENAPDSSYAVKHRRFLELCHNITVRSVIQMISDLSDCNYNAPTDDLGMLCSAMQSLALGTTDDPPPPTRQPSEGPRQSTLTKLQNLQFWGPAPRWLNYHEEAARKILNANDCIDPFWAALRTLQSQ